MTFISGRSIYRPTPASFGFRFDMRPFADAAAAIIALADTSSSACRAEDGGCTPHFTAADFRAHRATPPFSRAKCRDGDISGKHFRRASVTRPCAERTHMMILALRAPASAGIRDEPAQRVGLSFLAAAR